LLTNEFKSLIKEFYKVLNGINEWTVEILEKTIKDFINIKEIKFISFGRPMRLLLINQENGPSLNEILFILGKKITIKRINNYISLN
jgi:lysyl-tRNA synthetase class I